MKIKRFQARDMRDAIRTVRDEFGPDAVILSNRQIKGGIEVVSAIDFDEDAIRSLATQWESQGDASASNSPTSDTGQAQPTAEAAVEAKPASSRDAVPDDMRRRSAAPAHVAEDDPTIMAVRRELESMRGLLQRELATFARKEYGRRSPVRARTMERLQRLGLSDALCEQVVRGLQQADSEEQAWRESLAHLGNRIRIADFNPMHASGTLALVGPSGSGKTTVAARIASAVAARHGSDAVAMVALDAEGKAVQSPLMGIGQRLGLPTCMASSVERLRQTLASLVGRRLVLVDTPGMARSNDGSGLCYDELVAMQGLRHLVVVAANTQYDDLRSALRGFAGRDRVGCVMTKLDEASVFGSALSAAIEEDADIAAVAAARDIETGFYRPSVAKLVARVVHSARQRQARTRNDAQVTESEVPHAQ